MGTFENINDRIVYTKVKSRTEALSIKDQAIEAVQKGKSIAVIFGKHYHLYLAPGDDPYQVRKDIDTFLNPPKSKPETASNPESNFETASEPKKVPVRGADGKFVSKKQSILEPESTTDAKESPSVWDALE